MARDLELHITPPLGFARIVALPPGSLVVGRDEGCDVVLPMKKVSRRHVCFFRLDDAVFVEDLGTKNGTFVEGERVVGRVRVERGALVTFGDVVAAVTSGVPDDARHGDAVALTIRHGDGDERRIAVQVPVSIRFIDRGVVGSCAVRLWRGPGGQPLLQKHDDGVDVFVNVTPLDDRAVRLRADDVVRLGPFFVRAAAVVDGSRHASTFESPDGMLAVLPTEPALLER